MIEQLESRRLLHAGIPAPSGVGAVQPALAAVADFNGDGQADFLWRNYTTGENFIQLVTVNGNSITRSAPIQLSPVANVQWKLIGAPDMNGDGKADLFWQNLQTGQISVWRMNGTAIAGVRQLVGIDRVKAGWRAAGFGDFDGDGKDDIVWRNYETLKISFWMMDGLRLKSITTVPNTPAANWALEGAADLTGDGRPDLLWRNYNTGANAIYRMHGTTIAGFFTIGTVGNGRQGWDLEGAADFNSSGTRDLIFRNYLTGQVGAVFLGGANGITNQGEAVLFTYIA